MRQIQESPTVIKKFPTTYGNTVSMERLKLFSKVPLSASLMFLQNNKEYFTKSNLGNLKFSPLP